MVPDTNDAPDQPQPSRSRGPLTHTYARDVSAPKTFAEVMQLEAHGPDTWVGLSPPYEWGRV
ncbi:MAG: hypothetical protein ACI9BK_002525, partial [Acidimicrobiales bacterium]